MMIRIYFSCVFLCVILVSKCNGDNALEEVLNAVEKAVAFYAVSYTEMNIDGIFGLRVLEGQLKLMLDFLSTKSPDESGLQRVYVRLSEAYQRAKNISESSLAVLKESDQHYFDLMKPVIQHPWLFARNYRRIDPMLKWKNTSIPVSGFNERLSDRCMSELMGGEMRAMCFISRECVTVMSTPGMDGYAITHQLLYTMLAEQSGCLKILNDELGRLPNQSLTVEKLQVEFCANNFFETSRSVIMQKKVISFELQDLFLEQELVCTMLGFVEFLHISWLRQIISWQMPSGCFGESELDKERVSRREQSDSRTVGNTGVDFKRPTRVIHLAQPDEHQPLRSFSNKKPESLGNYGMLNGVAPLARVVPIPAGRSPREEFVGLNSNAGKSGYNDSRIRRGMPVMGMNPMDKERGQLGKHHIKLNHHNNFVEPAVGELNREQGRVGDTQVRMEGKLGNQGYQRIGNIRKSLIPMAETGVGNNQPRIAPEEESFKINRQINRKLLYEKSLKDGCLAHKTAVAMGALSQYLRFLIFANSSGFDATEHLFGVNYLSDPDSLLPSFAPTASSLMKKILLPFQRKPGTPAFMKSSTKTKLYFGEDAIEVGKRLNLGGLHDGQVKKFERHSTRDSSHLVELSADTKDSDHDSVNNMDQVKKGQKSELELYEEDDVNGVAVGTERPVVKSHEDELLLYDELVNTRPEASKAEGLVNHLVSKVSHIHSSGDASFEGVSSVSSTYAFVVVITAMILLLLYRALRKHRTGGQHRHGRWK